MNVCCCPPVPGCDLGDVCGICWGWARVGPCRTHCPGRDSPVGFSSGKGFVSFRARCRLCCPTCLGTCSLWELPRGRNIALTANEAPQKNQGWVSPSYPCGYFTPRRADREALVPTSHCQLLTPSPGQSLVVLLSVPASTSASSWGSASPRGWSQIPEQWEAASMGREEELILLL